MNRKKELKEEYKNFKPDMGVYIIKSKVDEKYFVEGTQDLKSRMNSSKFKLRMGNHPNKELQQAWKEHGSENFSIEILEKLEYDKDESKTDYKEELELLELIWEEKVSKEK